MPLEASPARERLIHHRSLGAGELLAVAQVCTYFPLPSEIQNLTGKGTLSHDRPWAPGPEFPSPLTELESR